MYMKKYSVFFILFLIILVTFLPMFVLEKIKITEEKKVEEYVEKEKSGQTINVLMHKTGEIVAMDVNDYLRGVVPSEMPPSFNLEALKAQAVVARTYLYNKIENNLDGSLHSGADICDNFAHCQAYHTEEKLVEIWKQRNFTKEQIEEYKKKINRAVNETTDIVIKKDGKCIKAFFHANSGGKTEDCKAIWNKQDIPYLHSVESLGEEDHKYYKTTNFYKIEEIEKIIKDKINPSYKYMDNIKIIEHTDSGRVAKMQFGTDILEGTKVREIFNLKSTNFNIFFKDGGVEFKVTGYGHGIGMSQTGANYYAKEGKTYDQIIKHYYQGVDVVKMDR